MSEENVAVTSDELDDLERSRRILFRWQKVMGEGISAHYAFEKPAAPFAVLGGNDALLMNRGSIRPAPNQLDGYFKVLVFAPAAVRAERLLRRSPELADCAGEWQARIEDNQSVLRPMVDMVLVNIDDDPSRNAEGLLRVMELHVAEGGRQVARRR
ncbi:hypothetical protein [Micromonospora sp. NPDC004551]|uniref:hypothetical protein n=1 Tax=Micromonospora sp. NPDC004551 TaxID=3154284 RepID=UPI0033B41DB7